MSRATTLIALAMLASPAAASASVVFTDSTFNLSSYTETPAFNSGATISFDQCSSCGNPGFALQIIATAPSGTGSTALGFINTSFAYNPTAGAITSISASVDKNLSTSVAVSGFGNTFRPTIEQNGNFYLAAIPGPNVNGTTTGYNTLSRSGLTAADFQEYDFSTGSFVAGAPNFRGNPMLFGLSQIFTLSGVPESEADYDNLVITVNIPEAPGALLLGVGLLGLGLARRRKNDLIRQGKKGDGCA